jgi:hypothetical protein
VLIVGRPGVYPDRNLAGVLAHECAHVLLARALQGSGQAVPRWFDEGFAVLEARPWGWRDVLALASTIIPSDPPELVSLRNRFPTGEHEARAAYAVSLSFVAFIEKKGGPGTVRRIVRTVAGGSPFPEAVRKETGSNLIELESEWRRGSAVWYRWIPLATSSAALWSVILFLGIWAGVRRRARRRRIEESWEREGLGSSPFDPPVA